jgi:hypothetical protein
MSRNIGTKRQRTVYAVGKHIPGESIRFAPGFANAGQIGGNYCEQNASSRINTEALVCLNLDVMMCRRYKVGEKVGKYNFYVI